MYVSPTKHQRRSRFPLAGLGLAGILVLSWAAAGQVERTATQPAPPPTAVSTDALPAAPSVTPRSAVAASGPTTDAAPTADIPPPQETPAQEAPTLFQLHQSGGRIMWVLDACSVLSLAIIFERLYSLRRSQVIPPRFMQGLRVVWRDPSADRERALDYCRTNDSPMARMISAFIKRLPRGFDAAERALEDAGGNEAVRLRSNLRFFYAIGACATLLGLIGTIAGMIQAFQQTAASGDTVNKAQLLSKGIYQAMVCTFGGLAVAILVTAFYYYFVGRVEKLITEINDELARFSDEFGWTDRGSPVGPRG